MKLLNHSTGNVGVYKSFLNSAMPTISLSSYLCTASFTLLKDAVTLSEEAFALLVLENNFKKWIFQAKQLMNRDNDNNSDEVEPNVLYQMNIKNKNNGKNIVGRWTEIGFQRYNDLVEEVKKLQNSRDEFEMQLMNAYINEMSEEDGETSPSRRKRKSQEIEDEENSRKITVVNTLDIVML